MKTVIPTAENMSAVFGKDGVETEIQVGQMRQTLGKPGFDWLFNKHYRLSYCSIIAAVNM